MSLDQEVVITGLGVVSPIGIGVEAFWDSLAAGVSGTQLRPELADSSVPIRLESRVQDFDPKRYIKPRKAIKIMCDPIQYGCAAAAMAVEQANILGAGISPDRIGTLFGTETFFADPEEVATVFRHCIVDKDYQHDKWGEFAMRKIQPLWMLKYLPNMAASHISIAIDARGHSNSICQGEASGLLALIEAATVVQRGICDVVVTGGTGSLRTLTSVLYRRGNIISQRFDEPESASRPFDQHRDGIVFGEGAGAMVVESAKHAAARGAKPLAKIAGWSRMFHPPNQNTQSDFHLGIESSFHAALASARLDAAEIDCVNADASGSVIGDAAEAQAIRNVFSDVPVVAHKSNFGNLGPGTSTVELVGAIESLKRKTIPPTINYQTPDPTCPVNVANESVEISSPNPTILKSSISTTGQIVSVILKSE